MTAPLSDTPLPADCRIPMDALRAAVSRSGYPLQIAVARMLQDEGYHVTEEWVYADKDTGKPRALDIRAGRDLVKPNAAAVSAARLFDASAVLFVECKRSVHPWLFFEAVTDRWRSFYPWLVTGRRIEVHEAGSNRLQEPSGATLFGLSDTAFLANGSFAAAFAQAELKGKDAALSGNHQFNEVFLPLLKAASSEMSRVRSTGENNNAVVRPVLALQVVVFDGPLFFVGDSSAKPDLQPSPWIRVFRQEIPDERDIWQTRRVRVVDVVRADALPQFLRSVDALCADVAARMSGLHPILVAGEGQVANLAKWTWTDIRPRPRK